VIFTPATVAITITVFPITEGEGRAMLAGAVTTYPCDTFMVVFTATVEKEVTTPIAVFVMVTALPEGTTDIPVPATKERAAGAPEELAPKT
jgi:hypothetical protein